MKKQTIAFHEAGHAVVAHRVGYRVDVVSIVPKEASEGRTKLPNPMRRKDPDLDRQPDMGRARGDHCTRYSPPADLLRSSVPHW